MRLLLLAIVLVSFAFAANPAKSDSAIAAAAVPDTIYDTVYVPLESGIPWNHEVFPRERLLRHPSFDPALTVAYTYSASFVGGSFGTFAQQSYLAHWNYEFSPDLHLFGSIGLWMPLYSKNRQNLMLNSLDHLAIGGKCRCSQPFAKHVNRLMVIAVND